MTSQLHKPIAGRRVFSVTCVVEAILLAGILVLLSQGLRPNFGGGKFVVITLFISLGLLLIATVRDVVTAIVTDRSFLSTSKDAAAVKHEWGVMLRGLALVLALFGLMLFVGTVVGMAIIAFVILRWHIGVGYGPAFAGAIVLGVVIPVAFGSAVGIDLWPGLSPELVPGWIGGGILPPL